jgi:hypothetical protein
VAVYRIHRLRDAVRQQFRWASHTAGVTSIRPKDYEENTTVTVEAPTCYAAWTTLKTTDGALQPGDVLESETGELRIFKYVGFEEAQWVLPESRPAPASASAGAES